MSYSTNNFLESIQYQIFLMKNVLVKDNSYKSQLERMKKSVQEIGESLELIRRRSDFRLVMAELEKMIEKLN